MRPLLLYIENNDNHLRLRSAVLEKHGYVVLAATNASRVLQTLRECPVSLVISDHMLEGLTGTEFVREIKTISPYVPILIYAGTTPQHLGEADCFMSNSEPGLLADDRRSDETLLGVTHVNGRLLRRRLS
jgi:CheY-like chemotaxis protein